MLKYSFTQPLADRLFTDLDISSNQGRNCPLSGNVSPTSHLTNSLFSPKELAFAVTVVRSICIGWFDVSAKKAANLFLIRLEINSNQKANLSPPKTLDQSPFPNAAKSTMGLHSHFDSPPFYHQQCAAI